MSNQEIFELMARFDAGTPASSKLTTKEFTLELSRGGAPAPAQPAARDDEALAQAGIRGEYGNGEERRRRLGSLYDAVQARVNEILS